MIIRSIALVGALLAVSACSSTFKAGEINTETNRFDTSTVIKDKEITVSKDLAVDNHKKVLFVRSNLAVKEKWDSFFEKALEKYGYFDAVMRKDEFEQYLIQSGNADAVTSVDGFTGLTKAQQAIGDFLVIDFDVEGGAMYQVDGVMSVYNPANAEVVFKVERGVTNWGGLDSILFEPMFNAFFDWIEKNSAATEGR